MAGWGHSGINPKLQISSVFPYQWPWMSQTSHRFASSFCQLHPSALVLSCQSWDKENHRDYTKAETWHHRCAAENIWDNQVMVANWILLQSKSVQLYGCLPRDWVQCPVLLQGLLGGPHLTWPMCIFPAVEPSCHTLSRHSFPSWSPKYP